MCINQSDDGEKREQVQRMCDIYTRAKVVLVWLGEAVPSEMDEVVKDPTLEARDFIFRTIELSEAGVLSWDNLESSGHTFGWSYVECVGGLLRSPWFSRLWVIQELALARKAVVIRGEISLSWDKLSKAVEALEAATAHSHLQKLITQYDKEKLAVAKFCRDIQNDIPT